MFECQSTYVVLSGRFFLTINKAKSSKNDESWKPIGRELLVAEKVLASAVVALLPVNMGESCRG